MSRQERKANLNRRLAVRRALEPGRWPEAANGVSPIAAFGTACKLLDHVNDADATTHVSAETIAGVLGINRKTVHRALEYLQQINFCEWTGERKGYGGAKRWRINLEFDNCQTGPLSTQVFEKETSPASTPISISKPDQSIPEPDQSIPEPVQYSPEPDHSVPTNTKRTQGEHKENFGLRERPASKSGGAGGAAPTISESEPTPAPPAGAGAVFNDVPEPDFPPADAYLDGRSKSEGVSNEG